MKIITSHHHTLTGTRRDDTNTDTRNRYVHKHIVTAFVWRDETEALVFEELLAQTSNMAIAGAKGEMDTDLSIDKLLGPPDDFDVAILVRYAFLENLRLLADHVII